MFAARCARNAACAAPRGLRCYHTPIARTRPLLRDGDKRRERDTTIWGVEILNKYLPEEDIENVHIRNVYHKQIQKPKSLVTGDWPEGSKRRARLMAERDKIFGEEVVAMMDKIKKEELDLARAKPSSDIRDADDIKSDMYDMIESGSNIEETKPEKGFGDYRDKLMEVYEDTWDALTGCAKKPDPVQMIKWAEEGKSHLITPELIDEVTEDLDMTKWHGKRWISDHVMTDNIPMTGLSVQHASPEVQPDGVHAWSDEEGMKTQDFFHLAPPQLREYAAELKELATAYKAPSKKDCLTVETQNFCYAESMLQSNQPAKQVVLRVRLEDLELGPVITQNMIDICGSRVDSETGCLRITSRGLPTRSLNRYDVYTRLATIVSEARKLAEDFPDESIAAARVARDSAKAFSANNFKMPGPGFCAADKKGKGFQSGAVRSDNPAQFL